jgi:hypothetical protein
MNTQKDIVDSKGNKLGWGMIVGMSSNDGPWSKFQGFVITPYSDLEGKEYCVAVFFGTEVCPSRFNFPMYEVDDWDRQHEKEMGINDLAFLFPDPVWQKCPRVVFFKPDELVVQNGWNIETLAQRIFRSRFHTLYGWPKGITETSADYMCFRKECQARATKVALWNVWGSVYPLHVCEKCFPETNGWCADDLPEIKKTFFLANGTPAPVST